MTQMSYISEYIPSTCVHPESRQASGKKLVIVPSLPHRSSGSTVDSLMLDDDEASSVLSDFRPSVDVIPEDPDEDNNDADNNNSNDEDQIKCKGLGLSKSFILELCLRYKNEKKTQQPWSINTSFSRNFVGEKLSKGLIKAK